MLSQWLQTEFLIIWESDELLRQRAPDLTSERLNNEILLLKYTQTADNRYFMWHKIDDWKEEWTAKLNEQIHYLMRIEYGQPVKVFFFKNPAFRYMNL
jgi:hypothetical protein